MEEEILITLQDIEVETATQTKMQPINYRPSRHDPNERDLLT